MPTDFLSQVDNVDTKNTVDPFLQPQFVKQLSAELQAVLDKASKLNKKQMMKLLRQKVPFVNTFDNKGVNGIAGCCTFNGTKIVFKISVLIDNSISHEYEVGCCLNSCRSFCPHFSNVLGSITLPISRNYIETERVDNVDSDEEIDWDEIDRTSLWEDDGDTIQTKILFYEYVSDCTLSTAFRYITKRNELASGGSCINMVLAAIQLAQDSCKLSHYDLHMDNILVRPCPKNMIFLYRFKDDKVFITPSNGLYPVIIDYGNSYCETIDNKPVRSSVANYHRGFQTCVFDKLVDTHLFLCSTVSCLEERDTNWCRLMRILEHQFGGITIFRNKGWKKLPNNLFRFTYRTLEGICPDLYNIPFWVDFTMDILEILVNLTTIPWKMMDYDPDILKTHLSTLINEFQTIDDCPDLVNDKDSLVCLKAMVDILVKNKLEFKKPMVGEFKTAVQGYYKVEKSFKVEECFQALIALVPCLTTIFYLAFSGNMSAIEQEYATCDWKRPFDAIKWVESYTPQQIVVDADTQILVMDGKDNKMVQVPIPSECATSPDHPGKWKAKLIESLKKEKII